MEEISCDFSGCDGGMSFEGDLSFQCDIGISSEASFTDGGDLSQLQFPGVNRLARQLAQPRAPRPSLGGAVLATPGLPVQTVRPTAPQPFVQYSTTTVSSPGHQAQPGYQVQPGYQAQPGYHTQSVTFQQPVYNGGAAVISAYNGLPVHTVQPTQNGLSVQTVQQTAAVIGIPVQRPVVVPPLPPPNWMGLSIFSLIFCTLPFGIIALFVSCMVNDSLKRGDHQRAVKNSTTAKWLNVLAIISGLPVGSLILYAIIAR